MVDRTDYRRASAVVAALVFVFASAPAAAKADELDTFAVRGNSVPEWLAYINRAKQQQPTGKSPDAVIAFTSRSNGPLSMRPIGFSWPTPANRPIGS